ncbi:MAG: heme A synthase [Acidimicrobiales bacterium]
MWNTRLLSRLTLGLTLTLVAVGGFTRGSGSGYGCKDRWPLCDNGLVGGFLPRFEYHMIIEWTHRWVAALVGVLALATAVSVWRAYRHNRVVLVSAIGAVVVIAVQAWVGRMVVKGDLNADLVSVHLGISMTVVALLTVVVVGTSSAPARSSARSWTALLVVGGVGNFVLLMLGSYVHNRYVSGWPLVNNELFPDLSNRYLLVHYLHRLLAGSGIVYFAFMIRAVYKRKRPQDERLLILAAASAYGVNVVLGAAHVFTKVSSSVLVATHLLMAALVWSFLVAAVAVASGRVNDIALTTTLVVPRERTHAVN